MLRQYCYNCYWLAIQLHVVNILCWNNNMIKCYYCVPTLNKSYDGKYKRTIASNFAIVKLTPVFICEKTTKDKQLSQLLELSVRLHVLKMIVTVFL